MNPTRSILICGALAGILVLCAGAGDVGSAASQPANWKVTDDPNWIGPNSWERHFTLGSFAETSHGMDLKTPASKPAPEDNDYYASRSRSTSSSSSGSTTGTKSTSSSSKKSDRSSRNRHSSSHDSSSRSSRSSSSRSTRSHSSY